MSHKRIKLTHTPHWAKGMRKLGPGVYATEDEAIHISAAEFCEQFGVPNTPENSRLIQELTEQVLREQFPSIRGFETVEEEPE